MEKLTCQNCGGPLTASGKCPYCGTIYKLDHSLGEVRYIQVSSAPVQTIAAQASIPHYLKQEPDLAAEYSLEQLSHELAKGLAGFMKIETREDPYLRATIIRGTVRVVPPDFMF